jgi:hypothetical protein
MSRANIEVAFQNGKLRKRTQVILPALAAIVVIAGIVRGFSLPEIIAATAFLLISYRNYVAGLFLTANSVIVREAFSTRHFRIDDVKGAKLVTGKYHFTEFGYINIEKKGGELIKVTSLRRTRIDGKDLAESINAELNKRRSTS